uniref:Uncharacterized protein n=1 Tax=Meloidogyne enterolobii TaxID=390850 RepID=A0A6V7WLR1_MELEN|nr:unnamed protein product [Meloidogyne enterolobii]
MKGNIVFHYTAKEIKLLAIQFITSQIPSQNAEKVYPSANHDETFLNSFQVQMEMVANHIVI